MHPGLEEKLGRVSWEGVFRPQELLIPAGEEKKEPLMIFLAGPTGCGKTALSLLLAEGLNGEIVSADSMQVYRGMDIGTAKATPIDRSRIPHHMIDVCDISEPFSVVDYYCQAQDCVEEIQGRGKLPIVVGGAGFYMHAMLYGPPNGPPSVPEVREQLEAEVERFGPEALYDVLLKQDPNYAATITPGDRHKIVRALEIIQLTGQLVSDLSWKQREPCMAGDYRAWFIHRPRDVLYARVEERCENMVEHGLIEETRALLEQGLGENRSAAQAIGYRQAIAYLESEESEADLAQFLNDFKKASRRYVKRQFTWFRHEPLFRWIDVDLHDMEVLVDMMIQDCKLF